MLWLTPLVVFAIALRWSAFLSGSETGFYRLSIPRLSIDSRAGDPAAQGLLWFAQRPGYFVATCLVGNNIAHYICSAAIGSGMEQLVGKSSDSVEVLATLGAAPVIFLFGDLLPKNLYYLTPYSRLKREYPWFRWCYRLLFPITWPLVMLTRLLEKLSGQSQRPSELLLGRNRFLQLVLHGTNEGVLNDTQSRLANGLLQLAPQLVSASMIPANRILGIADNTTRTEMLNFARKFGVSAVAVHRAGKENAWYGYALVAELSLSTAASPRIYPMPVFNTQTSKLEALYRLQAEDASYGLVLKEQAVLGIVAKNGLVEQIYRPVPVPSHSTIGT
ncbi:CNNM domain-containing protein [Planctomicrobium sp. SH664]|uniref:CNNM domain-containing protein n=1 Tax=Planctomicrobium sp. SH664 TaxID=3448125 RepID=UPI003F5AE091